MGTKSEGSTRERVRLTLVQKNTILLECKARGIQGGRQRIEEVQSWAAKNLGLTKAPSYRTVLWILRNEAEVTRWVNSDSY